MRKLYDLENLIRVKRYAGTLIVIPESVSDHVSCMNALAFEYIPKLNEMLEPSEQFDIKELIYAISIHDIDEAFTTDVPRTFKHKTREIEAVIKHASDQILIEHLGQSFVDEIDRVEDRSKPLGVLLKIIDVSQCGYKMKQEISIGNSIMKSEIDNVITTLEEWRDWLSEPVESFTNNQRKALRWLCKEFLEDFYDAKK
jgi:5'-deoxynucleotidase YfbR-like HD superfamily hydrolase